jgi:hypothetical protein
MPPPLPVILTNPAGEEYTFVSYSSAARFLDGKGVECNHDILKRCIVKIKPIQGWHIKHGTPINATNAINPFLYVFGEDASDIFQGKSVRVTSGTPKQVSIIDIINVVCRAGQPHKVYNRIVEQHSSIMELVQKHKFDGPGQKPTPVTDARGLVTIIQHLPGENADRFRSGASDILVRFLGGDTTLADDVHAIAAHHDAVNSGEAPANITQLFHDHVNPEQTQAIQVIETPDMSVQVIETPDVQAVQIANRYEFQSPTMQGKDLSMFTKDAVYMVSFHDNGQQLIKFGHTKNPIERITDHLREIPNAKTYCMFETPKAEKVEAKFKRKMKYTGKLMTLKINKKNQTEILYNIELYDAEQCMLDMVNDTNASADNEIMMQREKNVMDHQTEMMNINKEIALKKYDTELAKIDTELKKIDTELAVKKSDNELAMKNIEARMQIATLVLNNNPNLINESVLAVLLGIHK